jgi:hypothetical protein
MTLDYLVVASSAPDVTARFGGLDSSVAARSHIAGGTVQHHSPRPGLFTLTVDDAATPTDLRGSHFTVFDGIALWDRTLVRSAADVPAAGDAMRARGNFMLARHAGDEITLSADVLGGYPVFIHDAGGVFCASNNVFLVEAALGRLGVRLTPALELYAYLVTLGNGALDLTGFREVRLLEPGATVVIGGDNRATTRRAEVASIIYSARPVSELLDEAAQDLVTAVRAIADAPFTMRVCDLTGGFDSRMVLAAILHERLADDFAYFTRGNPPAPDTTVAALIRRHYGLRRVTGFDSTAPVVGVFQSMRHFFTRSSGCMSMFHGSGGVGLPDQRDVAHIGGAFGGLMRVIYGARGDDGDSGADGDDARAPSPQEAPLDRYIRSIEVKGAKWLTAAHLAPHLDALARHGQDLLAAGVRAEDLLGVLYLRNRLRYHFGSRWRVASFSRTVFQPLYSLAVIRGGNALSFTERRANRFGHELMKRLCPSLVELPFADKTWDPSLGIGDVPAAVTRRSPVPEGDEPTVALAAVERPGGDSERAAALRARGRHDKWVDFEIALTEFLRDHASPAGFQRLAPVFDVATVARFLGRPPESFGKNQAWTGFRLMAAYLWANRLEAHEGSR